MPPVALMDGHVCEDSLSTSAILQLVEEQPSKRERPGGAAPLSSAQIVQFKPLGGAVPSPASKRLPESLCSDPKPASQPIDSQTPGRPTGLFSIELKNQKKIFSLYPCCSKWPLTDKCRGIMEHLVTRTGGGGNGQSRALPAILGHGSVYAWTSSRKHRHARREGGGGKTGPWKYCFSSRATATQIRLSANAGYESSEAKTGKESRRVLAGGRSYRDPGAVQNPC